MFILYFLGVGPPCRLILCQFWLCEEAQCVYLRRHLGSPSIVNNFKETLKHPVWSLNVYGQLADVVFRPLFKKSEVSFGMYVQKVCPEGIQPCNMKNRDIY